MLVETNLAVVVHDTDMAAAVVVLPAGALAAAVVPRVFDDEAVLVSVPDAVPARRFRYSIVQNVPLILSRRNE